MLSNLSLARLDPTRQHISSHTGAPEKKKTKLINLCLETCREMYEHIQRSPCELASLPGVLRLERVSPDQGGADHPHTQEAYARFGP